MFTYSSRNATGEVRIIMFNGKFYHFSTLETLKIETFRFEVRERQRVRDLINSFFAYCQKKTPRNS